MTQEIGSNRRAAIKNSVDKIRRLLSTIDINITPLVDEDDMREIKEATAQLDAEVAHLTQLITAADA